MKKNDFLFGPEEKLLFQLVEQWRQIIIVWMDLSQEENLAEALLEIKKLSEKYNLLVANCFHAGDGNLHPLIMFDGSDKEQLRKTEEFGAEILKTCVRLGGVITGEHGVGCGKKRTNV